MFSKNSSFVQLWAKIPEIVNYGDVVSLLNVIDSERMDRFLSQSEEAALIGAVNVVAAARGIPLPSVEVL